MLYKSRKFQTTRNTKKQYKVGFKFLTFTFDSCHCFLLIDSVKDACAGKLLQAWLRIYDGNVLDLLGCLDVENSCKTAELALNVIFKKVQPQELVDNFDLLDGT